MASLAPALRGDLGRGGRNQTRHVCRNCPTRWSLITRLRLKSPPAGRFVPLVVLMCVQHLHAREMEAYRAENVVARVFIGCQGDPSPQIRDHSNMARAYVALGKEGVDEINALILHVAKDCGFADPGILSSDTTAQELPIGYPNEPGILRGLAQRCGRALEKLKRRGVQGVEAAIEQVQTILRTVKEHHLFAKGTDAKR